MKVSLNVFTAAQASVLKQLIIREILRYIKLNLSEERVAIVDDYLQTTLEISQGTTEKIIVYAIQHLKFQLRDSVWVISVDRNLYLPNTSYPLIEIVKLIDYGNLELQGTHLISNAFRWLSENLTNIIMRKVM